MSATTPFAMEQLLTALSQHSPDGILVVSPDRRMAFTNERFAQVWGFPADIVGSGDDDVALRAARSLVAEPDGFLERVYEAYAVGRPTHDEIRLRNGRVLDRYGAPLHDPDGSYMGWAWYFRDVTELRRAEDEQRSLAATLQASLLPPRPPTVPGMEVATRYRPGDTSLQVGGDFYDVFRVGPNDWGLVVGDVCGKGARAAALTAATRYTVRAAAVHNFLPSAVLEEVNAGIVADTPDGADDRFCTVAFARLELDVCGAWVTLASAGHPRPIVVRKAGWVDVRGQMGLPVGMFDVASATDDRVGLGPGDALAFFTDGITEARNATGEMFGDEALPMTLLACAGQPVEVMAECLVTEAIRFAAGRVTDDIAVLIVRVPDDAKAGSTARLAAATGMREEDLPPPDTRSGTSTARCGTTAPHRPGRPASVCLRSRRAFRPPAASSKACCAAGACRSWRTPRSA